MVFFLTITSYSSAFLTGKREQLTKAARYRLRHRQRNQHKHISIYEYIYIWVFVLTGGLFRSFILFNLFKRP